MRFQDSNRVDRECDRIGLRIVQREAVVATSATERRLAAIMVADVAGSSRLMERDETSTSARLRQLREEVAHLKVGALQPSSSRRPPTRTSGLRPMIGHWRTFSRCRPRAALSGSGARSRRGPRRARMDSDDPRLELAGSGCVLCARTGARAGEPPDRDCCLAPGGQPRTKGHCRCTRPPGSGARPAQRHRLRKPRAPMPQRRSPGRGGGSARPCARAQPAVRTRVLGARHSVPRARASRGSARCLRARGNGESAFWG